jgi:hypothetical protein
MIRTSKNQLRLSIAKQYIRLLGESRNLSEKEINELGNKWLETLKKRKMAKARPHGRVDVGGGTEVLDPDMADLDQELSGAEWSEDWEPEPERLPSDTQTQMRTADLGLHGKGLPGARTHKRRAGEIAESKLRALVANMIRQKIKEGRSEDWDTVADIGPKGQLRPRPMGKSAPRPDVFRAPEPYGEEWPEAVRSKWPGYEDDLGYLEDIEQDVPTDERGAYMFGSPQATGRRRG